MTGSGGLRIGTSERNAAMKALDQHLNDGRIGVEEYADRSAVAANATTADELRGLFTDLPAPHPVLPGDEPAAAAAVPAVPQAAEVAQQDNRFLEHVAPRLMAVVPIVALVLFFVTHQWWWFLLIPAAGAVLYGGHGRHRDGGRDRAERRRDRR